MQIIGKPKKYQLPFNIQKRVTSQQSENKLPNVYLKSRSSKSKSIKGNNKNITISYIKGSEPQHYRSSIRKGLSTYINLQLNEGGHSKFLPEQMIKNLREPVKTISYNSERYKFLFRTISQIFGHDLELNPKDIITAYGTVTQSSYLFITAACYIPYSICCQSVIYATIQGNEVHPSNRYSKKQPQNELYLSPSQIITTFICSKCSQPALIFECKSPKFFQQSRAIGKESLHLEAVRQKISMSIMVASGRFKRHRIDEIPQKDITITSNPIINYNPEDLSVKKRSQTLFLKPTRSRQLV